MTEAEWLACKDWRPLLAFMSGRWTNRKAILYVCAGIRSLWELLFHEGSQKAVEVAECRVEGTATEFDVTHAEHFSEPVFEGLDRPRLYEAANIPYFALCIENGELGERLLYYLDALEEWPGAWLIRETVGDPFRLISISPAVLTWNDAVVARLAQAAYDERQLPSGTLDNGRLAILADALEDAGCTNPDILAHCRSGGEHVRGCWVVDLVLGKEFQRRVE